MKPKLAKMPGVTNNLFNERSFVIGVVGLGYVGLPVALGFSKKYQVIGFDINANRIQSLQQYVDETKEVTSQSLANSSIEFTTEEQRLNACHIIIVTVPTPLNSLKEPDLSFLTSASTIIGKNMQKGTIIIYESTVYPGATEEVCIPVLEESSGFLNGKEFFVGYSPERINPGDKTNTFTSIEKIVAAQDEAILEKVHQLYQSVIDANVYKATSIKVAEAAKIVENTQRDINIAYMNELALIFQQMGISTYEVLDAARTKWNFLPFSPGLVGGHCIGVDPYYFIYKSKEEGYVPEFISAARNINDRMPTVISDIVLDYLHKQNDNIDQMKIGILGLTFKENVADVRNSKAIEIVQNLVDYGLDVYCYDPCINQKDFADYGFNIVNWEQLSELDVVILAVSHQEFREMKEEDFIKLFRKNTGMLLDIKGLFWQHQFPNGIDVINL
ncbi:nucleotide sugar dehydrogenase [Ornithinibacillus xuwenensis]|uniref:Nucleotide sugar dehydrogenase n=1 Tax=Ornithinibacillus xuwenensis TaxID=3144668 RepID=A0ABU9XII0_9BACI